MNALNSVLVEGTICEKPNCRSTPNGANVCTFSLNSKRTHSNGVQVEEVSYFDIETWAKLAEYCEKNLEAGRGVRVVGRLKQDRWVDDTGKKHSKIKIVAEHVELKPFK